MDALIDRDPFAPLSEAERTRTNGAAEHADGWHPILPAPEEPPDATGIRHHRLGVAAERWVYRDAQKRPLFCVVRFDLPGGGKEVLPLTYGMLRGTCGWQFKAPPSPRPPYNLHRLAEHPNAPVLVVEGEKAAEAATALFPDLVVTTWQGGSQAPARTDWNPLRGRSVIIWPDNDAPGRKAADLLVPLLREAGAASVRVVAVPSDWPDGWDVADPPPVGAAPNALERLLVEAVDPSVDAASVPGGDGGAMPPGFVLRPNGVFRLADDAEKPDIHVCSALRVVAATSDGAGGAWGRLLAWEDPDGRRHEWAMPLALLAGDGGEVRAYLLDHGLFVATGRAAREALSAYLMLSRPAARVRVVSRIGWHDTPDGRAFVLPDATLGPAGAARIMLQTDRPDALPPLARSGDLADWQREVAAPCAGNSRLVLALSAAFAAPLLTPLGAEGGGFHLRGASSTGKTTALVVAGSVWGGGGLRGWIRSWRTTDNALEAVAAAHSDLLLCLDEMGECVPEAVAACAYMLANGAGKGRAARDGGVRRSAEWRLLFLSTGEVGLADKLANERGGTRRARAGQEVRVVDLPADAGAGLGLFEVLHGATDGGAFAQRLATAARRLYGTAGRTFLERLVEAGEEAVTAAQEARRQFLASHTPEGASGQVRRVADRFALLAAAGEAAIALGVLPFAPGEAERAAARGFTDWLSAREGGAGHAEDAAAIAAVRRFLIAHGASRFETLGEGGEPGSERIANRAGWRKRGPDGGWRYLIPGDVWRGEVVVGLDPQAAAAALRRAGYLIPQNEGAARHVREERIGAERAWVYCVSEKIVGGGDG